jgi:hypothetical protein
VRVVRAILSLLDAALRDDRTTHVLLCTESCVPVATLGETARCVLLDDICPWEEEEAVGAPPTRDGDGRVGGAGAGGGVGSGRRTSRRGDDRGRRRSDPDWDRSYVDYYGRDSGRCSRFDEREFFDLLSWPTPFKKFASMYRRVSASDPNSSTQIIAGAYSGIACRWRPSTKRE